VVATCLCTVHFVARDCMMRAAVGVHMQERWRQNNPWQNASGGRTCQRQTTIAYLISSRDIKKYTHRSSTPTSRVFFGYVPYLRIRSSRAAVACVSAPHLRRNLTDDHDHDHDPACAETLLMKISWLTSTLPVNVGGVNGYLFTYQFFLFFF
jgi:hypothetical protein